MRIKFDFIDLEAFLAVMETASFHRAAYRLSLSQSAITRRIQKLEDALGSPLFERTTRVVKPTLAAKRLQTRAEAMLDGAEETIRAMRDESIAFAHQRAVVVTVALLPTLITPLFLPVLDRLRRSCIHARVRVRDLTANEVAEAVSQGDADFGVCSTGVSTPNTQFELLFDDEIVLAMPHDHDLARQDQVSWSELHNDTLILPIRGTGNRLLIDDAMAHSHLTVRWTYEVGRSTTAIELISNGVGVAPLPRSVMQSVSGRHITFKSLDNPVIKRSIGLLTRIGSSDGSTVEYLKTALRDCSRRFKGQR